MKLKRKGKQRYSNPNSPCILGLVFKKNNTFPFKYNNVTIEKKFQVMLLCFLGVHMFLQNISKSPANKSSYFLKNLNTKNNLRIICVSPIITICVGIKATARWEMDGDTFPRLSWQKHFDLPDPFFFFPPKVLVPIQHFLYFNIWYFHIFPFYFG